MHNTRISFLLFAEVTLLCKIHLIFSHAFSLSLDDRGDAAFNVMQYTEYTTRNFDIEILGFSRQYYAAVICCNNYREY